MISLGQITQAALSTYDVVMTPQIAASILRRHSGPQRTLNPVSVKILAADMPDYWDDTFQGICLKSKSIQDAMNGDVAIIDGQHRLQAVVLSGATIKLRVTIDPNGSYSAAIDRGTRRSANTILGCSSQRTAALALLWRFEAGKELHGMRPTLAQMRDVESRHTFELDVLCKHLHGTKKLTGSVLAPCVWTYPINPEAVTLFAAQVLSGEMIKRGDPVFAFRTWREGNNGKAARIWDAALTACGALHATLQGRQLSHSVASMQAYQAICAGRRRLGLFAPPAA